MLKLTLSFISGRQDDNQMALNNAGSGGSQPIGRLHSQIWQALIDGSSMYLGGPSVSLRWLFCSTWICFSYYYSVKQGSLVQGPATREACHQDGPIYWGAFYLDNLPN